jgi:feruloyl-CoA synthase
MNPAPKYRPLKFGVTKVAVRTRADGVEYVSADQALKPYAKRMSDPLEHWARASPDRVFIAQREKLADGARGAWKKITFGQAYATARSIAQSLIDRKLSAEKPVAILSENDIEHALLTLGCLLAGVPFCAVSPAYSLVSQDFEKLKHVLQNLTPGLVFASDSARYGKAINAAVSSETEVVLNTCGADFTRANTRFHALTITAATDAVTRATQAIDSNTIAKFLFTSGSTKLPKGVVNTHGMWCSNQEQMRQSMPVLTEADLVLVDWLPWNHTFGGNHNFGMVIYNGGTLYIDDGKPTPALVGETLRNLREIAPTVYFNVPTGFEAIANAMKADDVLRKNLLSRAQMFFYAGAALAQPIWDALFAAQEREIGERIVMTSGLGMTESGPFGIFVTSPDVRSGYLGLPTPGMELKLVPIDGKTEVRYRGPNVTTGYWRNAEATNESFDEEGFFKTGDAVLWIDERDKHQGLRFDGRIAEDFKLATGTFVSVGPMRAKIIAACAPLVQDVVITGINRHEVGALLIPTAAMRALSGLDAQASLEAVAASAPVKAHLQTALNALGKTSTGSASRVTRMHVLTTPPSIDKGEVTDKGSINQRAVLTHRADLVEALYANTLGNTLKISQ